MRTPNSPCYLLAAFLLFLLMQGCKECPPCPECPPSSLETQGIVQGLVNNDRMSLSDSDRTRMVDAFRDHFKLANGDDVVGVEQEVSWAELKEFVDDKVDGNLNRDRGIIFHYGVNGGAFRLGLTPVPLEMVSADPVKFKYVPGVSKVYTLVNSKIANTGTPYANWFSSFTLSSPVATGTYFHSTASAIKIWRTNVEPATYELARYGTDAEHELMPFEREVDRLHRENEPPNPNDYNEFVVITCGSVYDAELASYRHRLILHMRYRLKSEPSLYVDALSDRHSAANDPAPFMMRAADLGNLCPPEGNCGSYVLEHSLW